VQSSYLLEATSYVAETKPAYNREHDSHKDDLTSDRQNSVFTDDLLSYILGRGEQQKQCSTKKSRAVIWARCGESSSFSAPVSAERLSLFMFRKSIWRIPTNEKSK
jgi:hypothetical protein